MIGRVFPQNLHGLGFKDSDIWLLHINIFGRTASWLLHLFHRNYSFYDYCLKYLQFSCIKVRLWYDLIVNNPEKLWFDICYRFARQSKCKSRQVGCILVKNNHMLLQGFNGAPIGSTCEECPREKCNGHGGNSGESLGNAICAHGEANLIGLCARYGVSSEGCTLYCTSHPCSECAKLLVSAGIIEIVYDQDYPNELSALILRNAGIKVRRFENCHE